MDSAALIAATVAGANHPILPTGNGTKSALAVCAPNTTRLDMRGLTGIVSYEPSEYLISARAGTTISELQAALFQPGQFLPFDPMFVSQGATLGGTVASGLSGSGHMLYGSLRDFVMEVELVDGLGKLVRGGGKVVKNAAGFDLPKLMVGSYGRLGVLTEITLKVFPRPPAFASLIAQFSSISACSLAVQQLLSQPLPIASLDLDPSQSGEVELSARFAGPSDSLPNVLRRGAAAIGGVTQSLLDLDRERQLWQARAETMEQSQHDSQQSLVRIATTLDALPKLFPALLGLRGVSLRTTGGGSVAWLSLASSADIVALDHLLEAQELSGVVVRGGVDGLRALGKKNWLTTARRIQHAIDPEGKFANY